MLHILAQAGGEIAGSTVGVGGWASAGILVGVLFWIMYVMIPAKDKQTKEAADAKAAELSAKDKSKDEQADKLLGAFREEMRLEREQNLSTTTKLGDLLLQNTQETQKLAASVGNLAERMNQTGTHPPSVLNLAPGGKPSS